MSPLGPDTEAGRRFVAIAEAHVDELRARAAACDAAGAFPVESFDALKKGGATAAFVPAELGGLGLDSVLDWAVGLERLGRATEAREYVGRVALGLYPEG